MVGPVLHAVEGTGVSLTQCSRCTADAGPLLYGGAASKILDESTFLGQAVGCSSNGDCSTIVIIILDQVVIGLSSTVSRPGDG